jgi:hypothetical protein
MSYTVFEDIFPLQLPNQNKSMSWGLFVFNFGLFHWLILFGIPFDPVFENSPIGYSGRECLWR